MYVARRQLTLRDGTPVAPGQPVPEAESWSDNTRQAHLNLKWIEWVDGIKPSAPLSNSNPDKKNQKSPGRASNPAKSSPRSSKDS